MANYTTKAQRDAASYYIQRTADPDDSITYPQLFAAAGIARLANSQYVPVAAELLGYDAATLKTYVKRLASGSIILTHKIREGREIPQAALAQFSASKQDAGPETPAAAPRAATAARAATTALAPGVRIESVRRRMGGADSTPEERIARLEVNQEKLLDAVEKINEALRRCRGELKSHADILDVTQEAVVVLQQNVRVLDGDIAGLYEERLKAEKSPQ
jgi:hypothetical protein